VLLQHARQVRDLLDMLLQPALRELLRDPSDNVPKERGGEAEPRAREVADERDRAAGADGLSKGEQTPTGNAADGSLHARGQTAGSDATRAETHAAEDEGDEHGRKRGTEGGYGAGGDDLGVLFHPFAYEGALGQVQGATRIHARMRSRADSGLLSSGHSMVDMGEICCCGRMLRMRRGELWGRVRTNRGLFIQFVIQSKEALGRGR
jgi:hypothetical protein